MKILDVGAGLGRWTKELIKIFPDAEIVALDNQKRLTPYLLPDVKFVKGSVEDLPFKDNEFDLVIASRLLPYVDLKIAIEELERVTKKNGIVVHELIRWGYYLQKLLSGHPKRLLNFINLYFYFNFDIKLFKKYDNIDSIILTKYFSDYIISEKIKLKSWYNIPTISLLLMTHDGKVYKKRLHSKLIKIANEVLNQET